MSIEQAYFTRAKRAKFTGQAGYDVSDASRGINKKVSEAYIRPLGESIVFGGNSQADWAYCVTPSRQSRRIAVSRAFPASDGERTCQFVHTYLLDEDSVKQFFRRDGRDT
ncbi:MAG: hypothetical protein LBM16_03440, partial [Clostridiales bacterium]|nr:hypothetical protein [Clostridiales bacterium]